MQLSPVVTKGDTAELLEKKYVTRPRQSKRENVTAQSSRIDSFGDEVINKVKEALALSPTTSSTKNAGHKVTITNMRREMTVLTEEESKMSNDDY